MHNEVYDNASPAKSIQTILTKKQQQTCGSACTKPKYFQMQWKSDAALLKIHNIDNVHKTPIIHKL